MKYYVNEEPGENGYHEVHTATCTYIALVKKARYLGEFHDCQRAIREAKGHFKKVDGCFWCSKPCHKH